MPTNIQKISTLSIDFETGTNEDWRDSFMLVDPFSPEELAELPCAITTDSPVVSVPLTTGLVPGMEVIGPGIPVLAKIVSIDSETDVTLDANATETNASVILTFAPLPLDLTGLSFRMHLRKEPQDVRVQLELTLGNGRMAIDPPRGIIGVSVPQLTMTKYVPEFNYVYDLVAFGDGIARRVAIGNVNVVQGVTR